MAKVRQCQEPGCTETQLTECIVPDGSGHVEFYCTEHCKKYGYCWGCGYLCAGFESYDFSEIPGLCYECVQEFKDEAGEFDDVDDYDDYDDEDY